MNLKHFLNKNTSKNILNYFIKLKKFFLFKNKKINYIIISEEDSCDVFYFNMKTIYFKIKFNKNNFISITDCNTENSLSVKFNLNDIIKLKFICLSIYDIYLL